MASGASGDESSSISSRMRRRVAGTTRAGFMSPLSPLVVVPIRWIIGSAAHVVLILFVKSVRSVPSPI